MKNLLFIFLTCLVFLNCKTEEVADFEGFIKYEYTYESDSLNVDTLKKHRPSLSLFYYKDSLYLSSFIGQSTDMYIVNGKTGVAYYLSGENDTIVCEDYTKQTHQIKNYNLLPSEETVLGYDTRILEIEMEDATTRFWVSTDLKVNPQNFKNHIAYNWFFYLQKADGGIILKMEHEYPTFTMKGLATQIQSMEVPDSKFHLPENSTIIPCE